MLVLNRYVKYFSSWNYRIHTFLGTLIIIVTMFYGFLAMKRLGWTPKYGEWHNICGIAIIFFALFVGLKGKWARDRMLSLKRNHREMIQLKESHKGDAYVLIVAA